MKMKTRTLDLVIERERYYRCQNFCQLSSHFIPINFKAAAAETQEAVQILRDTQKQ
jgi:hypothetical protein